MKRLFKYLKPYLRWTILAPLFMLLEVFMDLLQPTLMSNIVDIGIANGNTSYILRTCLLMIGCAILGMLGGAGYNIFSGILRGMGDSFYPLIYLVLACLMNIILALGILFIPSFARIARSEMLRLKGMQFVQSAVLVGDSAPRIIFAQILPNAYISILSSAAVGFNNAVIAEAGLSYLGLGVQPPEASLGRMINEAGSYLLQAPWYAIFPGIAIIILTLGFSLISEGVSKSE